MTDVGIEIFILLLLLLVFQNAFRTAECSVSLYYVSVIEQPHF